MNPEIEVFLRLQQATPEQKVDIVLSLIETKTVEWIYLLTTTTYLPI